MEKVMLIAAIVAIGFAANAQTTKKESKKEESKTEQQKDSVYYQCPMKCKGDKIYSEAGKCPKCDMKMEKKTMKITKAKTGKKETAQAAYYCPMHTGETSDKPGKCSKCGMDFIKKQ